MEYHTPQHDWLSRNIVFEAGTENSVRACISDDKKLERHTAHILDIAFFILLFFHYQEWGKLKAPLFSLEALISSFSNAEAIWIEDAMLPSMLAGISEGENRDRFLHPAIIAKFRESLKPYILAAIGKKILNLKAEMR